MMMKAQCLLAWRKNPSQGNINIPFEAVPFVGVKLICVDHTHHAPAVVAHPSHTSFLQSVMHASYDFMREMSHLNPY
jgi:hypothetical protein